MNTPYELADFINLFVEGRIAKEDAARQKATAREILQRLEKQPGLILADEVGMGKTFVALSVAVSMAVSNRGKRPVVVMVPPALKEKWPRDFELFREKCVPQDIARTIRSASANRAVEFLKLLDDPPHRRKSIIFLSHGALHRSLSDGWVKLALIQQSLHGRHNKRELVRALTECMGSLLQMHWVDHRAPQAWARLLAVEPEKWLEVLHKHGIDPEGDYNSENDDEPVPEAVLKVLRELDTDELFKTLKTIPFRRNQSYQARLVRARREINDQLRTMWRDVLKSLKMSIPLLIFDEAHHLKNARTQLALLFQVEDAQKDAEEMAKGALGNVFERMLFLTATPFQLGHHELCSVLERFNGIRWKSPNAPAITCEEYKSKIDVLGRRLDAAQEASSLLDSSWEHLKPEDLTIGEKDFADVEEWWASIKEDSDLSHAGRSVHERYQKTLKRMREAEDVLKPWVVRHVRSPYLDKNQTIPRRLKFEGAAILDSGNGNGAAGLSLEGPALFPFLLAARLTALTPESRPVFAEGLASSFEAFLHTRSQREQNLTDTDDEAPQPVKLDSAGKWYLDQMTQAVKCNSVMESASHPKINATVKRAVDLWRKGEKVLIFCHYVATGRALRQAVSNAITLDIQKEGAEKIGCAEAEVLDVLESIGKRFFDEDSPIRQACDREVKSIIDEYPALHEHKEPVVAVSRRFMRTPSFLVRFFPLTSERLTPEQVHQAFDHPDDSGMTMRALLRHFFDFLIKRCGEKDRQDYLEAVQRLQTGSHYGKDAADMDGSDTGTDASVALLPNVQLINGATRQETRQRITLAFNTPFFPEILIASSVMAEGVDLHRNCRHTIHHDLCWNPSTLEQRTGRIDRIGAKAEFCGQPIHVYHPYIAETQDEKMFRVVMDRERWFKVVMGEKFKINARIAEKLAARIPLPVAAAEELAFDLRVVKEDSSD